MNFLGLLLPLALRAIAQQVPSPQAPLQSPEALSSEVNIPLLGFGTWNLKENCTEAVSWAIQTGYRHIDGAAAYGNEGKVGAGIRDGLAKANLTRGDIWVTSKLWNDRHSPDQVEDAIDESLDMFGLDYLDLYLMHWPVAEGYFGNKYISYRETWAAMTLLLAKGKARHIGVSNFDPEQLKDLMNHTQSIPSVHQMEMHPYLQQNEWLKFHKDNGIHVTAYSPLGGTNPTYDPGDPVPLLNNTVLQKIGAKRGCTSAQVALAWGVSRGTSVIPKTSHKSRIEENFASEECLLTPIDLKKLHKLGDEPKRYSNPSENWGVDLYKGLEDS